MLFLWECDVDPKGERTGATGGKMCALLNFCSRHGSTTRLSGLLHFPRILRAGRHAELPQQEIQRTNIPPRPIAESVGVPCRLLLSIDYLSLSEDTSFSYKTVVAVVVSKL